MKFTSTFKKYIDECIQKTFAMKITSILKLLSSIPLTVCVVHQGIRLVDKLNREKVKQQIDKIMNFIHNRLGLILLCQIFRINYFLSRLSMIFRKMALFWVIFCDLWKHKSHLFFNCRMKEFSMPNRKFYGIVLYHMQWLAVFLVFLKVHAFFIHSIANWKIILW